MIVRMRIVFAGTKKRRNICSLMFYLSRSATTSGPFTVPLTLHLSPSFREPDSHCCLPSFTKRHYGNRGGLHDSGTPQCGALGLQPLRRFPSHPVQAHGGRRDRRAHTSPAPPGAGDREARAPGQTGRPTGGQTDREAGGDADAIRPTVGEAGANLQH